jgi:hypothetical protein
MVAVAFVMLIEPFVDVTLKFPAVSPFGTRVGVTAPESATFVPEVTLFVQVRAPLYVFGESAVTAQGDTFWGAPL